MRAKTVSQRAAALAVALMSAACVAPPQTSETPSVATSEASEPERQIGSPTESTPVVAANFLGGRSDWSGDGGLTHRYIPVERNGEIAICGAFAATGNSTLRKLSREAMRQATVTLNGKIIMRNLRFFNEASNGNLDGDLVGVETNCRTTGQSAAGVPLNLIRVEMRNGRYRVRV